jgi:hypothetical protein
LNSHLADVFDVLMGYEYSETQDNRGYLSSCRLYHRGVAAKSMPSSFEYTAMQIFSDLYSRFAA